MAPAYLANNVSSKPINQFVEKGISNLGPTAVGDVIVYISAKALPTLSYHFKYLVACIGSHTIITTMQKTFYNLFKDITRLPVLFEVPVATFRFSNLTDAQQAELRALGLQQDTANKNLFVGTPPASTIGQISKYGPIDDRIRPGHLTYEAYVAWIYLMKGIMIFTTTAGLRSKPYANIGVHDGWSINKGETGKLVGVDGKPTHAYTPTTEGITFYTGNLYYAPPATKAEFLGVYHQSTVPFPSTMHGIFFGYFNGMNLMEKDATFDTFRGMFPEHLVANEAGNQKLMNLIRKGCRSLAFSRTGLAMAHIYKCISIAMDVPGCKLTVVLSGAVYQGCVIEGGDEWTVSISGTKYSSGDVSGDIRALHRLEAQAEEIVGKLNSGEVNGRSVYNFVKEDFLKSRRALSSFNKVDQTIFGGSNIIHEVKNILVSMEFGDSYPVPTGPLVDIAVSYMESGIPALIAEHPAYINDTVLSHNDRVMEALSMFGPRVPSFNTGDSKGVKFAIPGKAGVPDSLTEKVDGSRSLKYFPFWVVPLQLGYGQWQRFLDMGVMHFPPARREKKEFVNTSRMVFQIGADPAFGVFYGRVKGMVLEAREQKKGGKKRSRDDDDFDAPGMKRQKKTGEGLGDEM